MWAVRADLRQPNSLLFASNDKAKAEKVYESYSKGHFVNLKLIEYPDILLKESKKR